MNLEGETEKEMRCVENILCFLRHWTLLVIIVKDHYFRWVYHRNKINVYNNKATKIWTQLVIEVAREKLNCKHPC